MTNKQKWQKLLRWIRRKFPPPHQVAVKCEPLEDYGLITYYIDETGKPSFVIHINTKLKYSDKAYTLLHEWAHLLVWFGADHDIDHSDEWGLCYAKLYRAYERLEVQNAKDAR